MNELEKYYNKFNEDKRLTRRHGQVEYITSMKYIHEYLEQMTNPAILDIGAGTGKYCVQLANEGYDVSAVELVKYNLGILKSKNSTVKARQGNATNLSKYENNYFDMALLFGPMYHLFTFQDKLKALNEAKRVTKPGGIILVAYCMNEYSILTYGFKQNHINECIKSGKIDDKFKCHSDIEDLYDYMRIEDINALNQEVGLERIKIISSDGPANYMRQLLKEMDEETFNNFIKYHLSVCERSDLIGAGAHTLDILKKK